MLAGHGILRTQIERTLGLLFEVRGVVKCLRERVTRREFQFFIHPAGQGERGSVVS